MEVHIEKEREDRLQQRMKMSQREIKKDGDGGERDNRENKQEEREEAPVAHISGSSQVWLNPLGPMVEQTLISLFNDPTADLMTPAQEPVAVGSSSTLRGRAHCPASMSPCV